MLLPKVKKKSQPVKISVSENQEKKIHIYDFEININLAEYSEAFLFKNIIDILLFINMFTVLLGVFSANKIL